jgi:hypothetical protein
MTFTAKGNSWGDGIQVADLYRKGLRVQQLTSIGDEICSIVKNLEHPALLPGDLQPWRSFQDANNVISASSQVPKSHPPGQAERSMHPTETVMLSEHSDEDAETTNMCKKCGQFAGHIQGFCTNCARQDSVLLSHSVSSGHDEVSTEPSSVRTAPPLSTMPPISGRSEYFQVTYHAPVISASAALTSLP